MGNVLHKAKETDHSDTTPPTGSPASSRMLEEVVVDRNSSSSAAASSSPPSIYRVPEPYGRLMQLWHSFTNSFYGDGTTRAALALDDRLTPLRAHTIYVKEQQARAIADENNRILKRLQAEVIQLEEQGYSKENTQAIRELAAEFQTLIQQTDQFEDLRQGIVDSEVDEFRKQTAESTLIRQNANRRRFAALVARCSAGLTAVIAIASLASTYFYGPEKHLSLFLDALTAALATLAANYARMYANKKDKSAAEKEAVEFSKQFIASLDALKEKTAQSIRDEASRQALLAKAKRDLAAKKNDDILDLVKFSDPKHWYTDGDIDRILNVLLEEPIKKNTVKVHAALAPLASTANEQPTFIENIKSFRDSAPPSAGKIFAILPINDAKASATTDEVGAHWSLLVLAKDASGTVTSEYYDPKGTPMAPELKTLIDNNVGSGVVTSEKISKDNPQQTQTDGVNCGPMLVSNAINVINGKPPAGAETDWTKVRKTHAAAVLSKDLSQVTGENPETIRSRLGARG